MKLLFGLFCKLNLILSISLNQVKQEENLKILDKFLPKLDKFGDRVTLRAYADIPDPDIFINYDVIKY